MEAGIMCCTTERYLINNIVYVPTENVKVGKYACTNPSPFDVTYIENKFFKQFSGP